MHHLNEIIKLLASVQLALVIILLLIAYSLHIYIPFIKQRENKKANLLQQRIQQTLHSTQPVSLKNFSQFRHQQVILLQLINQFDVEHHEPRWLSLRQLLIEQMILPKAVHFAYSKEWTKRYLACQSFQLALTPQHEKIILQLIHDPVLIIAIHAALIAVSYDSQLLLDTVIDTFANNRHIQQSLYAQLMLKTHPRFVDLVHHRLTHETDPYVKAFCYRMLSSPRFKTQSIEMAFVDARGAQLELRIAAMLYLHAHNMPRIEQLFIEFLTDERWEVRAKAAKLLGKNKNIAAAPAIAGCLGDEIWWVRVSAAEALGKLGEKGLALLAQQTAENDPFAHDKAQAVSIRLRAQHD